MARQAGCTVMPLTPWCGFWAPPRSAQTSPVQCQGAGTLQSAPAACQPPPHAHSCLVTCPRYYFCFLMWQREQHPPLSCRRRSDKPPHLLSVICFNSIYFQLLASPPRLLFLIAFQICNIYSKRRLTQNRKLMPKPKIFEAEPFQQLWSITRKAPTGNKINHVEAGHGHALDCTIGKDACGIFNPMKVLRSQQCSFTHTSPLQTL